MKTRRTAARLFATSLVTATLAAALVGCAANDPSPHSISEPNRIGDARHPVVRAMTGATVEITRRDGTVLRGKYRGTGRMSDEEYARHWSEVVSSISDLEERFPAPGSFLALRSHRTSHAVRFAAFAARSIEVMDSTGKIEPIPFELIRDVREMDRENPKAWTASELGDAADAGRLPSVSVVRLQVGNGEIAVPTDQIADAEDRHGHELATGLLIGLVIGGVIAVVAWAASLNAALDGLPWW